MVPGEVAVGVEEVQFGRVGDQTYSVAAGDEWAVPDGWAAVHTVREEEGFHDCKGQAEADQEVGVWVQDAGVEPPGEKQTGPKFDDQAPVVGISSAEAVANHGTQEEGRTVRVQVAAAIASGFVAVVVEGDENRHCLAEEEEGAMNSDPG